MPESVKRRGSSGPTTGATERSVVSPCSSAMGVEATLAPAHGSPVRSAGDRRPGSARRLGARARRAGHAGAAPDPARLGRLRPLHLGPLPVVSIYAYDYGGAAAVGVAALVPAAAGRAGRAVRRRARRPALAPRPADRLRGGARGEPAAGHGDRRGRRAVRAWCSSSPRSRASPPPCSGRARRRCCRCWPTRRRQLAAVNVFANALENVAYLVGALAGRPPVRRAWARRGRSGRRRCPWRSPRCCCCARAARRRARPPRAAGRRVRRRGVAGRPAAGVGGAAPAAGRRPCSPSRRRWRARPTCSSSWSRWTSSTWARPASAG